MMNLYINFEFHWFGRWRPEKKSYNVFNCYYYYLLLYLELNAHDEIVNKEFMALFSSNKLFIETVSQLHSRKR